MNPRMNYREAEREAFALRTKSLIGHVFVQMALRPDPTLSLILGSAQALSARSGKWSNNFTKQVRTQDNELGCYQPREGKPVVKPSVNARQWQGVCVEGVGVGSAAEIKTAKQRPEGKGIERKEERTGQGANIR